MSAIDPQLCVLIPAAGAGLRLGQGPKALLELDGRPLLQWLAEKARRVAADVVIAAPPEQLEQFAALCPGCRVIAGGGSRQDSVAALARAASGEWLLLHDVARPFVSVALLQAVAQAARLAGCAGAFSDPEVPVARIENGKVLSAFARHEVGVFQAPQAFARSLLRDLVARAEAEGWQTQSTMQLALRAGCTVRAVPGEKTNIKLTTADDWALAEHLKDKLR